MNSFKNKLKDKYLNFIQFVKSNKKRSFFIFILLISFALFFIVFADDDSAEVTDVSLKINNVADGDVTVSNFDDIKYNIQYNLKTTSSTYIIYDLLVDPSYGVEVSDSRKEEDVKYPDDDSGKTYEHYTITYSKNSTGEQGDNITISHLNSTNGSTVNIILSMRTPGSATPNYDNNLAGSRKITVSATNSYDVMLTGGVIKQEGDDFIVPIGVVVAIPWDSVNGIKGKQYPREIDLSIDTTVNNSGTLNYLGSSNYNDSSNYQINNIPKSSSTNGVVTSGAVTSTSGNFIITGYKYNYENLYKEDEIPKYAYLSVHMFTYKLTMSGYSDVEMTFTPKFNYNVGTSITITKYATKVMGDFKTKIDLVSLQNKKDKNPTFNVGEEFYSNLNLNYVTNQVGDNLQSLTTYYKFDNSNINLLKYDENEIFNLNFGTSNNDIRLMTYDATVEYAIGTWDKDNFSLTETLCNISNISELTSNQLMNLYGGPCVKENSDKIIWKKENEITDEDLPNIMMVKITRNNEVEAGSNINLNFKMKVKDDSSIIGNSYQIVSNSTTVYNEKVFYLGEKTSLEGGNEYIMKNRNNYVKQTYSNQSIVTEQSPKDSYGNTVLVSAVRPYVAVTKKTNEEDLERSNFSIGVDDYIKWEISASGITNYSYKKMIVNVYIPSDLNHEVNEFKPVVKDSGTKNDFGDGVTYKKYIYEFSDGEIEDNTVKFNVITSINPEIKNESIPKIYVEVDSLVESHDNNEVIEYRSVNPVVDRQNSSEVKIFNNFPLALSGIAAPRLIEKGASYEYTMRAFNNEESSKKLELIYVLPFNSSDSEYSFDGSLGISLNQLDSGYTVYYLENSGNAVPASIITIEQQTEEGTNNNWIQWTDYTNTKNNVLAIKIVCNDNINGRNYFGGSNYVTVKLTPKDNKIGNEYANNFYIIDKTNSNKTYSSGRSIASVYNRKIKGLVFEDFDYSGLYEDNENTISDYEVELYKLSSESIPEDIDKIEAIELSNIISENDELIDSTLTDKNGLYTFKGLEEGYYYLKIKYDTEKYTVTEYSKIDESVVNYREINSKFVAISDVAVSKILKVDDEHLITDNVNLGLRIKQSFGLNLEKYITNIKVITGDKEKNYEYNNAKQVKLDLKTLNNTKLQITYKFELENSKFFPGYVGTIVETIPPGMTFNPGYKENYGWSGQDDILYYEGLLSTLIMPGEKYYFEVKLDLDTDTANDYINVISAGDVRLMETNESIEFSDELPSSSESENTE